MRDPQRPRSCAFPHARPKSRSESQEHCIGVPRVVRVQSCEEAVWTLRLHIPRAQAARREVAEVSGDDHLGFGVDRCCQGVPIVLVRRVELIGREWL